MDRAEMMRKQRTNPVVPLINLLKAHSANRNALICVFEGEDAKYYGSRVDSFIKSLERKNVPCKGKGNLLTLKRKVDQNSNLKCLKILFFADRDFDFSDLTDNNIYFTPCHSIENLYVSGKTFSRFLEDEIGLCTVNDKDTIEKSLSLFKKSYDNFLSMTLELNAWLMCQIEKSKTDSSIVLHLQNVKMKDLVKIEIDNIEQIYDISNMKPIFPESGDIELDQLESAKDTLLTYGAENSFRGKFILQFFRQFLDKYCRELSNKNSEIINISKKSNLTINDSNIISIMSKYAHTPPCLNKFLEHHGKLLNAS
ncbi:DUF4435 domain-containing protein [Vibrio sp. M250220]|uniref:DUF4435 domain-containing protein n=1 Tax=Vibrio sp. M250220 TaxID=3020894 RepID=UPI002F3EC421